MKSVGDLINTLAQAIEDLRAQIPDCDPKLDRGRLNYLHDLIGKIEFLMDALVAAQENGEL